MNEFYSSHLQGLQCSCVLPLTGQYLLVGTNGHLCVYNLIDNVIQTSVAHLNVLFMTPYKHVQTGSLVRICTQFHHYSYNHPSNSVHVIAINSQNLAICWDVAIGSNNEFISITPSFACLDGAISQVCFFLFLFRFRIGE